MREATPSHPPLSEILVDLVEPPAAEGSLPTEPQRYRALLLFAAAAWNASRLGGPDGWRAHLRELLGDASRAAGVERELGKELFETLSARAEEKYPEDPRLVADVRVARREDGRLQIYALSRPDTGRESDRRPGAARSAPGGSADDPLAGPRDLLDRTNLPADVEAGVEEMPDRLLEARGHESPGAGHLDGLAAAALGSPGGKSRGRPEPGSESPLREHVEEALGSASPESIGGGFGLDRFVEDHGLETADRHALRAAADRAVKAYYRELLGKDPAGRSRSTVLERPAGFGRLVREALRSCDASEEARDALALRAVAPLAAPAEDAPDFVLLAVARLAARGRLAGPALAAAVTLALRARGALDGIRTEELRPLWHTLGADQELESERRVGVLADLVRSAGTSRGSRRGAELLSAIARDEALPDSLRREVLERIAHAEPSAAFPGKTTPGVRRRAYRHLMEMADEPCRAAARLAREGREVEDFDRWRAAAEVVEEYGATLPEEQLEELVREGLRAPDAAVRQAWYRTGVKLVGGKVGEWAPEDVLRRAESRKRRSERGGGGDPTQTSLF